MSDIGAPSVIGVPAQREPVEMTAALDEESDRVALRLAIDAAGVGAFVWDLASRRLRWDERLLELFGLDATTFGGTIEAFNDRVHPDDRSRVGAALERAIATCGDYDAEYRVVLPDSGVRWIAARGRAFAETEGGPAVRLVGAAYDTTQVREGEARIGRVLETMSSAFYQLDTEWRFTYVNSEAERLLGASRNHLVGRSIWDEFPAAVDSEFESSYRDAVATGRPVSFEAYYPPPLDGWYEVRAWPSPEGLAVYFVDISDRREAQDALARSAERLALLASVSEGLTGTLDPIEGVRLLSTLLVPALADWCLVTLVDDPHASDWRRGLTDAGWTHADPEMRDILEEYASLRLRAMTDESYLARTIRDMTAVLMESEATEKVAAVLRPGSARDRLRELAPESAVAVPLRARGRTVGVVTVFRGADRAAYSDDDVALLQDIGARAGLALDNARLFETQRDVAEALQRSMLTDPPATPHLEVVTRYSPASDAARIGGDWYDAFLQQNRGPGNNDVVVVVGDVVGHDVEAAAAMGQVRGLLRGIAVHSGYSPAAVLSGVDHVMESLRLETTATAVVARLEHHPRPGAARRRGGRAALGPRRAPAGHAGDPRRHGHPAGGRRGQRPAARPRPRDQARREGLLPRARLDAALLHRRSRRAARPRRRGGHRGARRPPARAGTGGPRPRRALRPAAGADDRPPAGGRRRAPRRAVGPLDRCLRSGPADVSVNTCAL